MKILFDLRPALSGHSGIPQETRLLFNALRQLEGIRVDGLLQSSNQWLAPGLPAVGTPARAQHGWSASRQVAQSLVPGDTVRTRRMLKLGLAASMSVASGLLDLPWSLSHFDAMGQEDFLWRHLFQKSLMPHDYANVTGAQYRVARLPWTAAHGGGVATGLLGAAVYPRLATQGYDILIAETPYPGRVSPGTQLVIRYHDAVPLSMTHTVRKPGYDRAAHLNALRRNVADRAWFACVSDATRHELIARFPQVEPRAVTIHNLISPAFHTRTDLDMALQGILQARANPSLLSPATVSVPGIPYLLMVSTIEPRKNHLTLLAAWERLREGAWPGLQLVLVGELGWNSEPVVRRLRPWVVQGQAHALCQVTADELRCLYQHAAVTVCPSWGEGFGYAGIEALLCGGTVAASDLPVHREIYGDEAAYFDAAAADELASVLQRLLNLRATKTSLQPSGNPSTAMRYQAMTLMSRWQDWLKTVVSGT